MIVQVVLELEYRDWPELTFHTSAKLLQHGDPMAFMNVTYYRDRQGEDPEEMLTSFGLELLAELEELGVGTMFNPYAVQVRVPRIFNMYDTIDMTLEAFKKVIDRSAVHEGFAFGVRTGENVFERTDLKTEPTRQEVDAMVDAVVATLDVTPVRKNRGMTDIVREATERAERA